jgi:hypothetical protein
LEISFIVAATNLVLWYCTCIFGKYQRGVEILVTSQLVVPMSILVGVLLRNFSYLFRF